MPESETRTIRVKPDGEVATFLAQIRSSGGDAIVDTEEGLYPIHIGNATTQNAIARKPKIIDEALPKEKIWADYGPQRVKAALRRSAGIFKSIDADELIQD